MPWLEFSRRPETLEPGLVTSTLHEAGALPTGQVTGIEISPMPGVGQSASLIRIDLALDGAPAESPTSLVAKVPSRHAPTRALARRLGGYRREVRFYETFGADSTVPSPKIYVSEYEESTDDFVIVMEDLSAGRLGSPFYDSVEDTRTALIQLAAMHAAHWNAPTNGAYGCLRQWGDPATGRDLGKAWQHALPLARDAFGDRVSGYTWRLAETWLQEWALFCRHRLDSPCTLVHVDPHPGQMFFPTPAQPRFVLIDWQDAARAWCALDVARLLIMGLARETRRQHERSLIEVYYNALMVGGVIGLSREHLWYQIRIMSLWTLHLNMLAAVEGDLSSIAGRAERTSLDWTDVLIARMDSAMQDWDTGEALVRWLAEARHG